MFYCFAVSGEEGHLLNNGLLVFNDSKNRATVVGVSSEFSRYKISPSGALSFLNSCSAKNGESSNKPTVSKHPPNNRPDISMVRLSV